jgi:Mannosylglycerate hydrolase MGH1-like glycoside hydrolase domain
LTLAERAHALLAANTRTGTRDGRAYRFSVPSPGTYPFQWFWDSCFHAIVWSHFDRERAADELRALLAWQRPDGFVPHVVFWDSSFVSLRKVWHHLESRGVPYLHVPRTSEYVQPPVLAQAVERIGGDFVAEAYPAVAAFYRYLARERDPDRDGLVSIVVQFESGIDYSPVYGEASGLRHLDPVSIYWHSRRGEVVNKLLRFDLERIFARTDHHHEDVLYNAVYGDGLRALARLAEAQDDAETAAWALRTAERVTAALVERCWDEDAGLFFNLAGRDERRLSRRTILSLLPLLLPDLPAAHVARLVGHLTDERTFWTPWPVASVPRDDAMFLRDSHVWGVRFIWRGPCSMNTNWFLAHGLRRHGHADVADELARRSRELVERGGFNEFFDPIDGRPVGAPDFGWATLAVDL